MLIQVELKIPLHWQLRSLEINEIEVEKEGQKIQFEATETARISFYEKVCSSFKTITWNGLGIDPSKFYVNKEIQEFQNTEAFEQYIASVLHQSVLLNIIIDLHLFNEDEAEIEDLVITSITLKDEMLRRSLCNIKVRHYSNSN